MSAPISTETKLDVGNYHMVSGSGGDVVILNPPRKLTADEAMVFAAWIVAIASLKSSRPFLDFYDEVCNT